MTLRKIWDSIAAPSSVAVTVALISPALMSLTSVASARAVLPVPATVVTAADDVFALLSGLLAVPATRTPVVALTMAAARLDTNADTTTTAPVAAEAAADKAAATWAEIETVPVADGAAEPSD